MKKSGRFSIAVIALFAAAVAVFFVLRAEGKKSAELERLIAGQKQIIAEQEEVIASYQNQGNGIMAHGALCVKDGKLLDSSLNAVQLRGMSSHGLMWYPEYTNYRSLLALRERGANAFRIAVYSDQDEGYIYQPEQALRTLFTAVENTLGADMYAVVDWHVLRDKDPNLHVDAAEEFFEAVSLAYGNEPGIIYEICNEPNGDTDWEDITRYAERIISVIRKNAPDSVIIVGTPNYCTRLEDAMEKPLEYGNVMYGYHQYSATMDGHYEKLLKEAEKRQFPVFVSEWGISDESEEDLAKAQGFVKFLNERELSWFNWSLSNKAEESSAIKEDEKALSGWSDGQLTLSGRLAFEALRGAKQA